MFFYPFFCVVEGFVGFLFFNKQIRGKLVVHNFDGM